MSGVVTPRREEREERRKGGERKEKNQYTTLDMDSTSRRPLPSDIPPGMRHRSELLFHNPKRARSARAPLTAHHFLNIYPDMSNAWTLSVHTRIPTNHQRILINDLTRSDRHDTHARAFR